MHKLPLKLKLQLSRNGMYGVLRRPKYLVLAIIISVLFFEIIFWFNNFPLLQYILGVPTLSPLAKLQFLASTYTNLWQSTSSPLAVGLFILSILQGIVLSGLIFTMRRQTDRNTGVKVLGGSSVASILATLGLGCASCGTSLITPVLLFLFSSSSVALAENVGLGVTALAIIASLYALYSVGLKAGSAGLRG